MNRIVRQFVETIKFANQFHLHIIDLKLVAIGEAQLQIDAQEPEQKAELKKEFREVLAHLKALGEIYDFYETEHGFMVNPEQRIYLDQRHLELTFDEEEKDIA